MRKIVKLVGQPDQGFVQDLTVRHTQHSEEVGTIYPQTGAELGTAMGHGSAAQNYYLGNESSGATDLGSGGNNLSDVNTPTHNIINANGLETVVRFDTSTTDSLKPSTNTELAFVGQSLSIVIATQIENPSGLSIVGKWSGAAGGWIVWTSGGIFRWTVDDGTNRDDELLSVDPRNGQPELHTCVLDLTGTNMQVFSSLGDSTGQVPTNSGPASNTNLCGLGNNETSGSPSSAGMDWGMLGIFSGTNAEGITVTEHTALETFMGIF